MTDKKHVIVIGAGFGGLNCVQKLAGHPELLVTLVDRNNYHLFLPLLYQVAIAGLEAPQIAQPARALLSRQQNARFQLGTVNTVDVEAKIVQIDDRKLRYDYLVVATGSRTAQLGIPGVNAHAFELKKLGEAMSIRDQILSACEEASRTHDSEHRSKLLTFIIVGGGPTGVEMAGSLSELGKRVIPRDFPEIKPEEFRVILIESSSIPISDMTEKSSLYTKRSLERDFDVELHSNSRVSEATADGVQIENGAFIGGFTTIWTAGVEGAAIDGLPEPGKGKTIPTTIQLNHPDHPELFVVGDINGATNPLDGSAFPQLAPVAIQQGKLAARNIMAHLAGRTLQPFSYNDRGQLVTIGRSRAVAEIGALKFQGFPAWIAWLVIHLVQLVGFRNRWLVLSSWIYSYLRYDFAVRIMHNRHSFPND